jgi:hypothetical protein
MCRHAVSGVCKPWRTPAIRESLHFELYCQGNIQCFKPFWSRLSALKLRILAGADRFDLLHTEICPYPALLLSAG